MPTTVLLNSIRFFLSIFGNICSHIVKLELGFHDSGVLAVSPVSQEISG